MHEACKMSCDIDFTIDYVMSSKEIKDRPDIIVICMNNSCLLSSMKHILTDLLRLGSFCCEI